MGTTTNLFARAGAGGGRWLAPAAVLGALALLVVAMRAPTYPLPIIGPDEKLTTAIAQELIGGKQLYRDIWINHPPVLYKTLQLASEWTGRGPMDGLLLLRVLWSLLACVTMWWVFAIARLRYGTRGGLVAAAFYAIFCTATRLEFIEVNHETLSVALIWTGFGLWLTAHRARTRASRLARNFSAGALWGLAFGVKFDALSALAVLGLESAGGILLARGRGERGVRAADAAAAAAGVAAILGLGVWHLSHHGALENFLAQNVGSNVLYAASLSLEIRILCMANAATQLGLPALLFWLMGGLGLCHACRDIARSARGWGAADQPTRAVVGYWLLTAAIISSGGRFFDHYFVLIMPPTAILAGPAFYRLWAAARGAGAGRRLQRRFLAAVTAVCLAVPLAQVALTAVYWLPSPTFMYANAVAEIRRIVPEEESIFVWGGGSQVYADSGRRAATPFLWCHILTGFDPNRLRLRQTVEGAKGNIRAGSCEELMVAFAPGAGRS